MDVNEHTVKLYMYLHCYGTVCRPPGRKWLVETATKHVTFVDQVHFKIIQELLKVIKMGNKYMYVHVHVAKKVCNN